MADAVVQITLKYDGNDVDDGTMSISDVIAALQGFSSIYGKIASTTDPNGRHQIRVSEINKSSFAVVVLAWATQHREDLIKAATAAAPFVVSIIIKLIDLKKSLKGKEPSVQVNGDGNIVLSGSGNTNLVVTKELYEVFRSKGLDTDLAKITRPLEEGKIDRAELSANDNAGFSEHTEILSTDKPYFQAEESTTVTSKPVELTGELVSLNKERNRGTFRMQNGNKVQYHLAGDDPSRMYADFARKGSVRVQCVASFNEDLEVRSLEITSITPLQTPMAFENDHSSPETSGPPKGSAP